MFMLFAGKTDRVFRVPPVAELVPLVKQCHVDASRVLSVRHAIAVMLPAERSVAVRLVQNEFCRRVIHKLGRPLVSTSANLSGEETPTTYAAISEAIRRGVDWTADPAMEEPTATHRASSIIALSSDGGFRIVRR